MCDNTMNVLKKRKIKIFFIIPTLTPGANSTVNKSFEENDILIPGLPAKN